MRYPHATSRCQIGPTGPNGNNCRSARTCPLVVQLRGVRAMPSSLRVEIQLPSDEPMLWIPDPILGAIGDFESGNPKWLDRFSSPISRYEI